MRLAVVEEIGKTEPRGRRTRIIAVDGFGGCGKSVLADRLAQNLGEATIVRTDDFSRPHLPGWEWGRLRQQVLEPVMNDRPGHYQRYDWERDEPAEWRNVPVGGNLIVEGVSSMRDELGTYWDYGIWLECPHDRLQRGVERDGEAMRSMWTDVWIPEEDAYFRVQRPDRKADLVIDSSKPYEL